MQGKTRGRLFSNDISSAYPAQIAKLPSMAGGRWRQVFCPTRAEVFSSCMLSEFRAKTRGFPLTLPFYPLPWRTKAGAVVYRLTHTAFGCAMISWACLNFKTAYGAAKSK